LLLSNSGFTEKLERLDGPPIVGSVEKLPVIILPEKVFYAGDFVCVFVMELAEWEGATPTT
jgi:hypothetical protein